MVHLQSTALDLARYEELLQRFQREYQEIQGHGEDLLHHQQELQRHGQFLLRLHEDSRRHAQSVKRLYEDNQNHASRLRSMEGMVRSLFNNSLNSIRDRLKSSGGGEGMRIEQAVVEKASKSSETSETEDDLVIKVDDGDGGVDSYAAKTLIDLAGQDDDGGNNPPSSSCQGVVSRNVVVSGGGLGMMKEKEEDNRREMAIERVDEGMLKGKETMKDMDMETETSRVNLDLGCRFHPTDQELIACLVRKVAGESTPSYIREKNLYGTEEPQDMFISNSAIELYFFTLIKKKYDQGKKIDRVVGKGTWKIQSTKEVYDDPQNKSRIIGFKRTLNFVEDLSSLTRKSKNSWIMHEYILNAPTSVNDEQGRWAICRIKRGRGNRVGLPPTSSFSPIAMCLKRPGEDNAAHESQMPDSKIAKTSKVLLLTSATVAVLPEQKTAVPAAKANVEAPQQDHIQGPCVLSSLDQASCEAVCEKLDQASAEAISEKLDQAYSEVTCEKLEQAPVVVVTCEKLEQVLAEATCEKLAQAPLEVMCEKLEQALAEATCEKLEQAPLEVRCEKLEQAPLEVMCEKLEKTLAEVMCEKLEKLPSEVMYENLEKASAEVMCEKLEQTPAEVIYEKLEQVPSEVMYEKLEQAPAEVTCEELEEASTEVMCEELDGKQASKKLIVYKRRPKNGSNSKGRSNKTTSNVEAKFNTYPKKMKESKRKSNYKPITDFY